MTSGITEAGRPIRRSCWHSILSQRTVWSNAGHGRLDNVRYGKGQVGRLSGLHGRKAASWLGMIDLNRKPDFCGQKTGWVSAAYNETAGKIRRIATDLSHNQPGDPSKLADMLIMFTDALIPPVGLLHGSDTVAAIEPKHATDAAILTQWRYEAV